VSLWNDAGESFAIEIMAAAQKAGAAIMDIYATPFAVSLKPDNTPVTDADRASEEILLNALHRLMPGVPVIAEEQAAEGRSPEVRNAYFAVDPLDGTKEFLKLNGEFTINVALIAERAPVFGLIFAPAFSDCYVTLTPGRAYRCALQPSSYPASGSRPEFMPLAGEAAPHRPFTAVISRSDPKAEALAFLERMGRPDRKTTGSALKFGILARGEADVYPRFGSTSEWDTAAGQAILEAAGGEVVTTDGEPLRYGKAGGGFINPPFIAWRRLPSA
jgi:3'(2'), 5'-bisphosphate nucleotidase